MSSNQPQREPQSASSLEEIRATRLEKVEQLKQLGLIPYAYQWKSTHDAATLQDKYASLNDGEEVEVDVAIAGRIIARRVFGKLAFLGYKMKRERFNYILIKK
jgi:lysyl-tRNA synthetase class 2